MFAQLQENDEALYIRESPGMEREYIGGEGVRPTAPLPTCAAFLDIFKKAARCKWLGPPALASDDMTGRF